MRAVIVLAILVIVCALVWIALRQRLGPIVLCIDNSGSMHGANLEWSQRFATAVQNTARRKRQDLQVIYFTDRSEEPVLLKRGRGKMPEPGRMGGTEFSQPLNRALELVKDGEKDATIIMLTDGMSYGPNGWMETFKDRCRDMGVVTHLAYLHDQPHPYQDPSLAYPFADHIYAVNMRDLTIVDPYALLADMGLR